MTPAWLPVIFRFAPPIIAISIWSYARTKNLANVLQNGIFPAALIPAATLTMFCSAMRHSSKRLWNFLANSSA